MSVGSYKDLVAHVGHNLKCVKYGSVNVAVECRTCNEIIVDFDNCPNDGDTANDCKDCAYSGEYHFEDGECVRRED